MRPIIKIKRVYEKAEEQDGCRVLVDRLWPKKMERNELVMNEWAKKLAPSLSLGKWYGFDPDLWDGFQRQYIYELKHNREVGLFIQRHLEDRVITLLFAASNELSNPASVLKHFMEQKLEDSFDWS